MAKNKKDNIFKKVEKRIKLFKSRRPHQSFRLTRRRDYTRSLQLPGYIKFTKYVFDTLWKNKKVFLLLALFIALLTMIMVGISSQDTYSTLKESLDSASADFLEGNLGTLSKAGLLFISAISGSLSGSLTESQQIYSVIIFIITWLTSVWLLRNILANRKVKLRDGLYNSGAPILPTFMIMLLLVIQLLPLALAILGYSAALATGLLDGGVEAMLFWAVAGLLALTSVYLIAGTFFALIIVTLPGMYPSIAIKTAGDMVVGRRLRIIARIAWMALGIAITWVLVVIPIILIDSWIKSMWPAISWVPTVPIVLLVLTPLTAIWISSYIYLLYRKVVDDGAEPA